MKKLKLLYFQNGDDDSDFIPRILKATGYNLDDLKKMAEEKIDKIIADYAHFQVKTIDSMISYISKISANDMQLSPDFELNFNIDESIDYSVGLIVSELTEESTSFKKIIDYVNFFVESQNKFIWQPVKSIQENIKEYVNLHYVVGLKIHKEDVKTEKIKDLKNRIISCATKIQSIALNSNIQLSKKGRNRINKILIEKSIEINKVPITTDYLLNNDYKKYDYLFFDAVSDLNEAFHEYVEYVAEERAYNVLMFLDLIEENMDGFIKKKGIVPLSDLTNRLKNLLKEDYIPEIFYKLGSTYYHYLIDEFQDTSRVQWEIIEKLIENVIAENGSLFYVGDVKQAIYRFRGGDISLFSEIFDKYKGRVKRYQTFLDTNYRSVKEIVDFNNKIFSEDNLRNFILGSTKDGIFVEDVIDIYSHVEQKANKTDKSGYVCVEECSEIDEILNEKLPGTIRNILDSGYSNSDICILTRKNSEGETVANILMEKGYPVIFDKVARVNENTYVNEIISFLKFLNNPMDNLSFFSFVSGEIFLKKSSLSRDKILDFMFDNRENKSSYRAFQEHFPDIWGRDVEPFVRYVNYLPLYDTVTEIIKHFDILENFKDSESYIMKLLEIIKDMGEKGELSIDQIVEKWKEGEGNQSESDRFNILIPEYINAIKIMTVHKAKGLAFPVVILPYSLLDGKKGNTNKIYKEILNDEMYLMKIKKDYTKYSQKLKGIYSEETTKETIDDLNTLYVAMTRAEEMMFIYTTGKNKKENSLLFSGDETAIHIGKPVKKEGKNIEEKVEGENYYACTNVRWYANLAFHGEDAIFETVRREAVLRGDVYHKMFEEIIKLNKDETEALAVRFSEKYKLDKNEIKGILDFITGDKILKGFYSGDIEVFNEKEIVTGKDDVYRMDRLVIKGQNIYVIDYKTGEEYNYKHIKQIKQYMKLAEDIYGKKSIGVLIYIDEKKKMVING
ncbi:MAG: UvrD-helicase domain-containing protein [Proteobacteria bacterium]|nr:UvrD-helicase domain-containing protein [Pseudomonadota bacterium]